MHLVESLAHHSMILKAAGVKKVESMSQCRRTEAVNVKERVGQTGINVRIFSDDGKRFAKVATSLGKHAHPSARDTNNNYNKVVFDKLSFVRRFIRAYEK